MGRQIVIDITPAGSVKIDAQGFNGQGCEKATQAIEVAINGEAVAGKKKKPEYYAGGGTKTANKNVF